MYYFQQMVIAFLIPISFKESQVRKNIKRHWKQWAFLWDWDCIQTLSMLNRHPGCLFPAWHLTVWSPTWNCPTPALGRPDWVEQEMVGLHALALPCVWGSIPSLSLSLAFAYVKFMLPQTDFSLNLWTITTINSVISSLVTDGTLSGPAYLFIVLLLHATVQWRACLFLGQDLTQALLVVSASLYEVKK